LLAQEAMSLAHSNAVLEEKATKLVDHCCSIADQPRTHPMERLQVQLIVSLYRNAACRWALQSFRDRVGIPELILVALPKRLRESRRHLFDHVTERNQFTCHLVRGHARLDPDQAWPYVHKP
jgi:hypothetical protein